MCRTAVNAGHPLQTLAGRQNTKSKFGGNLHLIAKTFNRFSDQNFIIERTIYFGGIRKVTPMSMAAWIVFIACDVSAPP